MSSIFSKGGHTHEPHGNEMGVSRPNVIGRQGFQFLGVKSKFGRFLGNVNLKQHLDFAVEFRRFAFHDVQHFQAIHAMDEVHKGQEILDFVGLDVANHVPSNVAGKALGLAHQFLHAVFPKVPLTGVIRVHQVFVGLGFAHGNECDFAVDFLRVGGQFRPDLFQPVFHSVAHGRN